MSSTRVYTALFQRAFFTILLVATLFLITGIDAKATPLSDANEVFAKKDFVQARKLTFRMLKQKKYKDNYKVIILNGWSEFLLDNFTAAKKVFEKYHKKSPRNFDANLGLAWINIKLGNFDEVEPYLDVALKKAEKWQRYMVYDARGWLAAKRGDEKKAESYFKREDRVLVKRQKKEDDPMVGLGWLALNKGNLKEAKKHFNEGLKRKKDCFFCNDGLARVALAEKT